MIAIIGILAIIGAGVEVVVVPAIKGDLDHRSIEQIRHEETIKAINDNVRD